MSQYVYKYPLWPTLAALDCAEIVTVSLPDTAQVLRADIQNGALVLWALVDPSERHYDRRFRIAGTGHAITHTIDRYVSTVYIDSLVFHVFELQ